jgi:hypothetical protein
MLEPQQQTEAVQWKTVREQLTRLYRATGREADARRIESGRS